MLDAGTGRDGLDGAAGEPAIPGLLPGAWSAMLPRQRRAGLYARGNIGRHLWWACGAGKTRAAVLWAVLARRPTIVVTRGSILDQWDAEFRSNSTIEPHLFVAPVHRRARDESLADYTARTFAAWQADLLGNPPPVIVAGWSTLTVDSAFKELRTWAEAMRNAGHRPAFVWDESHVAKDFRRQQMKGAADGTKRFSELQTTAARAAKLSRRGSIRLLLTATPIPDRRRDLWAQLDLANPRSVGDGPWPWLKKHCGAEQGAFGWRTDGETNTEELIAFLAPLTDVVTSEELWQELPPCERELVSIPPEEQDAPDQSVRLAMRRALKALKGKRGQDADALRRAFTFAEAATRKRSRAVALAVEELRRGGKVLVFTGLRADVQAIADAIQAAVPEAQGWAADGSTSAVERAEIRRAYQAADGPAFLVGTGAAWGESANLHHTTLQIIVSLPWTWGQIRQWEGRVRRLGQPWAVRIVYLSAEGTIDDRVFPLVRDKLRQAANLLPDTQIDAVRTALAGGTDDELIDQLVDDVITGKLAVVYTASGRRLSGQAAREATAGSTWLEADELEAGADLLAAPLGVNPPDSASAAPAALKDYLDTLASDMEEDDS